MSEERREKQQQGQKEGASAFGLPRKYGQLLEIVLLLAIACSAGWQYRRWYYKNHKYDNFAKCLAGKQAKMYGLYWCPHCAEQKEMLGASFHYIPYVECAIKDKPKELAPECKAAGAKLFPSWQFGEEPPKEGVLSLEALSEKTGCSLP